MGITNKVTGRVKQAAGDLMGKDSVRQEGRDEERKAGEAKEELRRDEVRAEEQQRQAREEHARQEVDRIAEQVADERAAYKAGKAQRRADKFENPERRTSNTLG
jgi:uncharacterized protein YjbJ (UPF0337 family)